MRVLQQIEETKQAYHLFKHIHAFANFDKEIAGYKYAIQYGRLYFERSRYKRTGDIDLAERSRRIDTIIDEYKNPKKYRAYIRLLKELQNGLTEANRAGLIYGGAGRDIVTRQRISDTETAHYQQAMSSLETLIPLVISHPFLWRIVFRWHV